MKMETYYQRRQQGLCTQCGLPLPEGCNKYKCEKCMIKTRENAKRLRDADRYQTEVKKLVIEDDSTLDEMATEAHEKHLTYGQLQAAKIIERLRREKNEK